jgi:hypothetical protein
MWWGLFEHETLMVFGSGGFVGLPDWGWKSDDYKILALKNRIGRHERHGKAGA